MTPSWTASQLKLAETRDGSASSEGRWRANRMVAVVVILVIVLESRGRRCREERVDWLMEGGGRRMMAEVVGVERRTYTF